MSSFKLPFKERCGRLPHLKRILGKRVAKPFIAAPTPFPFHACLT